jgi:hypothetical protein
MNRLLGEVRLTGTSATGGPLFIGIAADRDVSAYLSTVEHSVVSRLDGRRVEPVYRQYAGQAPAQLPGEERFWVASTAGTGTQTLDWRPRAGDWSVVVLNADGSRVVQADLAAGATVPWLDDLAFSLIGLGLLFLLAGALLISLALRASHGGSVPPSVPLPDTHAGAAR